MENIGYFFLGLASACWVFAMMMGMISVWPYGGTGMSATVGIGFLFAKLTKERLKNKEDSPYDQIVDK